MKRRHALSSQQSDSDIVDVGSGGPGDDEATDGLQGVVGVVVCKDRMQIQTCCLESGETLVICVSARRVRGSVGSVAADGEDSGTPDPRDAFAGGESQLLVPAAETLAGQMNDGFAPCDECRRVSGS